jgi:hypothetical protein
MMDLGSGERGALDELDSFSDKQGDLTVVKQTRVTRSILMDPPPAPPSPFYRRLGLRVLVEYKFIDNVSLQFPYTSFYLYRLLFGCLLGLNLYGILPNINQGY